jgi:uncharacterized radical SAM protein YgiQ
MPPSSRSFLPTTKKEVEALGWDRPDVILFTGDAYIDHPSFGAAVIGRTLEAAGYRVAIVPQPDWRSDHRDFTKLGEPRLFFGVTAGAMDSMINHYTAAKRLRSDDAYTPDRRAGMRPDYPTIVYTNILKSLFPNVPVVLGGIEASLRRLAHYDYWADEIRPSILVDSRADLLVYGMGERPVIEIARRIDADEALDGVPQTARLVSRSDAPGTEGGILLHSYEECKRERAKHAHNFRLIEEESNRYEPATIFQPTGDGVIIVHPPYPPATVEETDRCYDLPYTRLPHPKYRGKDIPAYEMIKHSVNTHRGCFGGCAFCTISAHQGKFVSSRSMASIIKEVEAVTRMDDFKGYVSDLGGPSANMYMMKGREEGLCRKCRKPSCIFPAVCPNLNADHAPIIRLYREVDRMDGIKKSFIGSGVRYDLIMHEYAGEQLRNSAREYAEELIRHHVSGRLKVAPEHTEAGVLRLMRKPDFSVFESFRNMFEKINRRHGLNQQLIPYFISAHPACTETDMASLAVHTMRMDFRLEQVQDFTPSPMTLATEIYCTGINPYSGKSVYCARTPEERTAQRMYFFWYKPEYQRLIRQSLKRLGRDDLAAALYRHPYRH